MNQEWRQVVGASGYEVSADGQVRSIERVVQYSSGSVRTYSSVLLKQVDYRGYRRVCFRGDDGRRLSRQVHSLVCRAFHGPPSEGQEVRHLNGIKDDNRAENLAWGTKSENAQDSVSHGVHPMARKTHCPKGHPYEYEYSGEWGKLRTCGPCRRDRQRKEWHEKRKHLRRAKRAVSVLPEQESGQ